MRKRKRVGELSQLSRQKMEKMKNEELVRVLHHEMDREDKHSGTQEVIVEGKVMMTMVFTLNPVLLSRGLHRDFRWEILGIGWLRS